MEQDALETLRRVFLDEGAEQLDGIHQALMRLEVRGEAVGELDVVLRLLHNLKGSAAGVQLSALAAFVHALEDRVEGLRGRERLEPAEVDHLLEAADALTAHLDELEAAGDPAAAEPDGPARRRMRAWLGEDLGEEPGRAVEDALRGHPGARRVEVRYRADTPMLAMRAKLGLRNLHECGTVLACAPPEDDLAALAADPVLVVAFLPAGSLGPEEVAERVTFPEVEEVRVEDAPGPPGGAETSPEPRLLPASEHRVRVRVGRIDDLLHLAAELRASREEMRALVTEGRAALPRSLGHALDEVLGRQDRLLRRLTDDILATRMVPVGTLFRRFPRMVRDLCRKLGRKVDFHLEGEGTELDAKLVDRIADPVVHLLRNALDHGIEAPEVRSAAGKDPTGRVVLRALAEGQTVRVEVEDDGRGLDLAAIRAAALDRGLVRAREAETLDEEGLLRLLTRHGFSTREEVSAVSGRGVGLDVVKEAVENLNGEVALKRLEPHGTRVTLRFPLTLALADVLSVRVGEERFALPVGHVEEVLRQEDVPCEAVPGRGAAAVLRERPVPLLSLEGVLHGQRRAPGPEERFLVVMRSGGREVALGVRQLLGEQEVVVKPLTPHFPELPGVAGATLAQDGSVVLILDVPGALRRPGRVPEAPPHPEEAPA